MQGKISLANTIYRVVASDTWVTPCPTSSGTARTLLVAVVPTLPQKYNINILDIPGFKPNQSTFQRFLRGVKIGTSIEELNDSGSNDQKNKVDYVIFVCSLCSITSERDKTSFPWFGKEYFVDEEKMAKHWLSKELMQWVVDETRKSPSIVLIDKGKPGVTFDQVKEKLGTLVPNENNNIFCLKNYFQGDQTNSATEKTIVTLISNILVRLDCMV